MSTRQDNAQTGTAECRSVEYPYFSGSAYINGRGVRIRRHGVEFLLEVPSRLARDLFDLCDGSRSRSDVIESLASTWQRECLTAFLNECERHEIVIEAGRAFIDAWSLIKNPSSLGARKVAARPLNRNEITNSAVYQKPSNTLLTGLLSKRQSTRTFSSCAVPVQVITDLLWAGYGIPSRRSVPSGGGLYPLKVDLILLRPTDSLPQGIYRVSFDKEQGVGFECVAENVIPIWRAWGNPEVLSHAQGIIVISSDFRPTSDKYGNRSALLVAGEAGHVAQNIALAAAEVGVGAVEFAGFEEDQLAKALGYPKANIPLTSMVFGSIPSESELHAASCVPPIDFRWMTTGDDFHVGRARVIENDLVGWCWGQSSDPRIAHKKAVAEALERHACATLNASLVQGGQRDFKHAISVDSIVSYLPEQYRSPAFPFEACNPEAVTNYVMAEDVLHGIQVAVPADVVFFAPTLDPHRTGKPHTFASTSGVAAHESRERAMESAVLELIERDAFMVAWLSRRWYPTVAEQSLPAEFQPRIQLLQEQGYRVVVKDISQEWAPVLMLFAQSSERHLTQVAAAASFEIEEALDHALTELEAGLKFSDRGDVRQLTPNGVALPGDHACLYRQRRYYRRADFLAQASELIPLGQVGRQTPKSWRSLIDLISSAGMDLLWIDLTFPGAALAQGRQPLAIGRAIIPGLIPISFGFNTEPLGLPRAHKCLVNQSAIGRSRTSFHPLFPHPFS